MSNVPRLKSREDRGHKDDCVFVDNHGPSCKCDGLLPAPKWDSAILDLHNTMRKLGWLCDDDMSRSFHRKIGAHSVYVGKVNSGWQYKWQKDVHFTIFEEGSFGTVTHCLDDLWEHLVMTMDRVIEADRKQAQRKPAMIIGVDPAVPGQPSFTAYLVSCVCGETWGTKDMSKRQNCPHCNRLYEPPPDQGS